jgi:hypothetical protein
MGNRDVAPLICNLGISCRRVLDFIRQQLSPHKRIWYPLKKTLSEPCIWSGLNVFENRVLRRIFGSNRDEVTGKWRKLHKKELYALYLSPDIIRLINSRRLRWAGHVACRVRGEVSTGFLVGRPEGKRRPRRRWEDNITLDLLEVGCGGEGHRLARSGSG